MKSRKIRYDLSTGLREVFIRSGTNIPLASDHRRQCRLKQISAQSTLKAIMNESDVRTELKARGLSTKGYLSVLRRRLDNYDARGELEGDLATMSNQHLRTACKILSIESKGERHQLVGRIEAYNSQKRELIGQKEDPGEINCGLPSPDDRLGKPAKYEKILGTPGSGFHSKLYCAYLTQFEKKHNTTEKAWTLRFLRIFMNPDFPTEELWPPRYSDCRVVQSDEADVQCVRDSYESILNY